MLHWVIPFNKQSPRRTCQSRHLLNTMARMGWGRARYGCDTQSWGTYQLFCYRQFRGADPNTINLAIYPPSLK